MIEKNERMRSNISKIMENSLSIQNYIKFWVENEETNHLKNDYFFERI